MSGRNWFASLLILGLPQISTAGPVGNIQQMLLEGKPAYFPENDLKPSEISFKQWNSTGKDTIILIHGLGGSLYTWENVAPVFARNGTRVIAMDQRGHGNTLARGYSFSSTTMAHDVLTLMNELKIEKATLIGHSMGGRTVLRFGQLFPERTTAIVVEDMHALGRSKLLYSSENTLATVEALRREMLKRQFQSKQEALAYLRAKIDPEGQDEFFDQVMSWKLDKTRGEDGRSFYSLRSDLYTSNFYHSQGLQEDLSDALRGNQAPLLFIKADSMPVLWGKGVDHIVENNPSAKIVEIANTGHGVHADALPEYVALIEQFVAAQGQLDFAEVVRKSQLIPRPALSLWSRVDWGAGPNTLKEIRSGADGTGCERFLWKSRSDDADGN